MFGFCRCRMSCKRERRERQLSQSDPPGQVLAQARGIAFGSASASATATVRRNFAIRHLRAAVRAAREALAIEQANLSEPFGPWFEGMMLHVPVSGVLAAAALEAN